MIYKPVVHQFTLFDYNTMRPKGKVPISAERIRQAKKLIEQGDGRGAAEVLRQVRESLEEYEQRITNKPHHG